MTFDEHTVDRLDLYISGPAALLEVIPRYLPTLSFADTHDLSKQLVVAVLQKDRLLSIHDIDIKTRLNSQLQEMTNTLIRYRDAYLGQSSSSTNSVSEINPLEVVLIHLLPAFDSKEWVAVDAKLHSLVDDLGPFVSLLDELDVVNGFWKSRMCDDLNCCPHEGRSIGGLASKTHIQYAQLDTPDLVEPIFAERPMSLDDEAIRDKALSTALNHIKNGTTTGSHGTDEDIMTFRLSIVESITRFLQSPRRNRAATDWQDAALLVAGLHDIHIRDCVLKRFLNNPELRESANQHFTALIPISTESSSVVLLTALAGSTWLDGHADFAHLAIRRALDLDPSYSLALLLNRALNFGVPATVWSDSLEAVTQEECLLGAA